MQHPSGMSAHNHHKIEVAAAEARGRANALAELREWRDARAAFLALERADTRTSEEARAALDRLSNAEAALFAVAQIGVGVEEKAE